MKVLIVTNVYPSDNNPYSGLFVKEQIEAVEKYYPDVTFDIYYINHYKGKYQYVKSIWEVNRLIKKGCYDLVHIHYGLAGLFLVDPFKKKIPTIVTYHGSDIQPKGGSGKISITIAKYVATKVQAVVILNDLMKLIVEKYCDCVYMIPCSVNTNTFRPIPRTMGNDKIHIVFPSNHNRAVKNYPLFCKTISILKKDYSLDIEEHELKGMSREEIALLYSNADVLLMTSQSEGSPQVIKEAMACNLPCVSTPVGDVSVLLNNVKDSYVSKEHDANELALLVAKSLKHEGSGIPGREKCFKLGIDEESTARKVYELYKDTINKFK